MSALLNLLTGKKSPAELVASLRKLLNVDAKHDTKAQEPIPDLKLDDKLQKGISSTLVEMKAMLFPEGEEARPDVVKKLTDELLLGDTLLVLLYHMKKLEFEARKDVAALYQFILKSRKDEAIAYFQRHPQIMQILVTGYTSGEVALQCGSILRDAVRHETLCSTILTTPTLFDGFFSYVQLPTFDVASDAFATFKFLLTKHKNISARFLDSYSDPFFQKYNTLLQSENYVTKRQSLKLLYELLMNRANYNMMVKYINSSENLKVIMNVLRANTKAVQLEAFHVFKIFIANPNKSRPVLEILTRNKEKLIKFLTDFNTDEPNPTFATEKAMLLDKMRELADTLPPAAAAPAPAAAATSNPQAPK